MADWPGRGSETLQLSRTTSTPHAKAPIKSSTNLNAYAKRFLWVTGLVNRSMLH
jgi:hypothetical protein